MVFVVVGRVPSVFGLVSYPPGCILGSAFLLLWFYGPTQLNSYGFDGHSAVFAPGIEKVLSVLFSPLGLLRTVLL